MCHCTLIFPMYYDPPFTQVMCEEQIQALKEELYRRRQFVRHAQKITTKETLSILLIFTLKW